MTEPLAEFLAPFYGVIKQPEPIVELQAWCASSDGQAHDAPNLTVDDNAGITFATDADRTRYTAMQDAMTAWIIGTLHRPPGWTRETGTNWTASPPEGASEEALRSWHASLQIDSPNWTVADGRYRFPNELRDWARTWTAAHPS